MLAALTGSCALMGSLGFVHQPGLALAVMFAIGALNGFFNIILVTAFQVGAQEEFRGRVMGLLTTVALGIAPSAWCSATCSAI